MSVTFSFLAGFFELLPLASSHFCHGQAGKLFNCLPFDLGKKKNALFHNESAFIEYIYHNSVY